MPFKDPAEKRGYNTGYRAGWRAAVCHFLGNRCQYPGCTVTGPKNLEIHHKLHCSRRGGRGPKDWENLDELEIYCKPHHDVIEAELDAGYDREADLMLRWNYFLRLQQ